MFHLQLGVGYGEFIYVLVIRTESLFLIFVFRCFSVLEELAESKKQVSMNLFWILKI
jgi:hypothetical protein